jgi:Na+-driven multidrug efflux pump
MMTIEGPITSATISRLPNKIQMLAAYGVVISLSVFIESPIINLLATSTALVKDQASYRLARRFTLILISVLTLVTFAIGFINPIFELVVLGILGVPADIAQWVRPGMQIMLLFTAAIGWRRFQQGVLINLDQGKRIAQGTGFRLIIMILVIAGLANLTELPGIYVGSISLITGIIAESLFITWHTRKGVVNLPAEKEGPQLTMQELFWFHMPLAGTSAMILIVQPLVSAALARMANPTESLAVWPIVFQTMLVLRAPALSLPEVVIAKTDGIESWLPLRTFALTMTVVMLVFTTIFTFTPLSNFYLMTVQGLDPVLTATVSQALPWLLLFPVLWVINAWLRGLLISYRATGAVNGSMATNLVITLIVLALGISSGTAGLVVASIAMVLAAAGETVYQAWRLGIVLDRGYQLLVGKA